MVPTLSSTRFLYSLSKRKKDKLYTTLAVQVGCIGYGPETWEHNTGLITKNGISSDIEKNQRKRPMNKPRNNIRTVRDLRFSQWWL
jgi:hypothetical protein